MAITLVSNQVVIARNAGALYGVAVGTTDMSSYATLAGTNTDAFLNTVFVNSASGLTAEAVASALVTNLGITGDAAVTTATNYIVGQLNAVPVASRGAVVNNILNLFSGMESDATFGTFATAWNIKVANAVAYATVPGNALTAWENIPSTVDPSFALTSGTDIHTANIFNSDLVYTPAGNFRINSLQDEDKLTGTGTNPTLNATLGNANDNGGTIITPTLIGIETANFSFTGTGAVGIQSPGAVVAVDLQDATGLKTVNINRISQTSDVARIENVKQVLDTMGIANSNSNDDPAGIAEFSFGTGTLATGAQNVGKLNLDNVQIRRVNIGENITAGTAGVQNAGYEKLTINSGTTANAVGVLGLPMDFGTTGNGVTITGDKGLTLAYSNTVISAAGSTNVEVKAFDGGISQAQGRLDYIDGSALNGPLTLNIGTGYVGTTAVAAGLGSNLLSTGKSDTSGQTQNVTITGTASDDTFYLNDFVQAGDILKGGNGTDTVVVYSTPVLANGNQGVISSVEKVDVQVNGTVNNTITLDFDKIADATSISVRNITNALNAVGQNISGDNAANQVVNLNNLTAAQAGALTIAHSTTGNGAILDTTLNAALKTNTANDTLSLTIAENVNIDPRFNFTLGAGNFENITIVDADTEANTIALTSPATITGTLTIGADAGKGLAGTFINFDNAARAASVGAVAPGVATVGQAGAATFDQRGGYRLDVDGQTNDFSITNAAGANGAIAAANVDSAVSGSTANVRYNTLDNGAAADTRITAQIVDASKETSDVIIRLGDITRANGISSQQILGGSGNDTFIFDAQGVRNSGYTSGDTVSAGTGLDTLVIDGNTAAVQANGAAGIGGNVSVQKSEWDNTSGIDVLRLAGNQGYANVGNAAFQVNNINTNGYYIEIDNEFVKQTDAGNNLKIVSNDGDLSTNVESDLLLNLRPLSQTSNVTFVGANSNAAVLTAITPAGAAAPTLGVAVAGNASNRVQVEDNSANGANILDGGDTLIQGTPTAAGTNNGEGFQTVNGVNYFFSTGNNNVLEVFNTADVSINDLSNTKNFGRIEGTNDVAIAQTLKLVLNDTIVDQLVDNGTAARTATTGILGNVERLVIKANNNANVAAAVENLSIDATAVTNKFGLDVFVARGAVNTILGSAGADKVLILGNYNGPEALAGGYAAVANNQFTAASEAAFLQTGASIAALQNGVSYYGADGIAGTADDVLLADTSIYNLGTAAGQGDVIEIFGGVDLSGATISAGTTIIAHSSLRLTPAQLNSLAGLTFSGAGQHGLSLTGAGAGNLGLVTVNNAGGTLTISNGVGVTNTGTVTIQAGGTTPTVNNGVTFSPVAGSGVVGSSITLTAAAALLSNSANTNASALTTTSNDAISSTYAFLSNSSIDGGTGNDTLTVSDAITSAWTFQTAGAGTGTALTSIETINLAGGSTAAVTASTYGGATGANATQAIRNTSASSPSTVILSTVSNDATVALNTQSFTSTGTGVDTVTAGNTTANTYSQSVNLGAGNDFLTLAGTHLGTLTGGDGTDTLTISDTTVLTNATVTGFETLVFGAATKAITFGTNSLANQFTTITGTLAATDTINIAAGSHDISAATITGFNDAANNNVVNIATGATLTIAGDSQFSATDTWTNFTGAGTLQSTGTLTFGAADTFTGNVALTGSTAANFTDVGGVARTITGNSANNTINLGVTTTAAKSVVISSGGVDTIQVSDAGTAATTITGFTAGSGAGADVLDLGTAAANAALAITMGASGVVTTGATLIGAATDPTAGLFLSAAAYQVSGALTQVGDGGAVEAAIMAAGLVSANTANNKSIVVLDNGTDTGVYLLTRNADAGGTATILDNASDFSVVLVGTLVGVADAGTLVAANIV